MKMMKKALFVMLTVAIVACVLALSAAAETTGTYGKLSYSITDGEVTITACDKTATEIEIPETIDGYPIIKIGNKAFYGCSKLTQLTINARNFTVGSNVFWGCGSATDGMTVVFGDSVEQIPDRIMSSNEDSPIQIVNIKKLSIGENVKVIGDYAFSECINLASITMSDSVEIIGDGAFSCCYALTEVDIPSRVSTIGNSAFYSCNNLESVTIGDSVETIGDNAFYCCSALAEITIPDSVEAIGDYAFCECSALKTAKIGNTVKTIGCAVFWNCSSLTEINIPETVLSIAYRAFYNCTGLTKINWNAKKVSDFEPDSQIFSECGSANEGISVIFGEGVEYIPEFCFTGNENIKSLSISNTVKIIGTGAFEDCSGFTSITIPDSVTTIGDMVFRGCSNLTDVTIGNSVSIIDARAFSGCVSLINVTIGKSVETIDEYSFIGCTSLKNISIPESVEYIATDAFYGSGLEKIVINNPKCVIEYSASTIPVDAVIYGYADSPAQMYAQMYGRDFVALAAAACTHSYGEWIIDADASCTQRGFAHRVCALCNGYEFDVLDETGHADEDADGYCDVCDAIISAQTPDTGDNSETQTGALSGFLNSITEFFNRIIAWIKSLFGMA